MEITMSSAVVTALRNSSGGGEFGVLMLKKALDTQNVAVQIIAESNKPHPAAASSGGIDITV